MRIRHRGLRELFETGQRRRLRADQVRRIRRILTVLDRAENPDEMRLPGFGLHRLRGELSDFWAVSVSGNWRISFRWEEGEARDVDLVDYH